MIGQFSRIEMIYGEKGMEKLHAAKVAVFGIGGVGGYVVEALARSGIGHLLLVDKDVVSVTNINRQIVALHSTVGKSKVKVMKDRCLDIKQNVIVEEKECYFNTENNNYYNLNGYSPCSDSFCTFCSWPYNCRYSNRCFYRS